MNFGNRLNARGLDRAMKRNFYWVGIVAFVAISLILVVCLWTGVPPEQKVGAIALGIIITLWMTEPETRIDSATRAIIRRGLLFGRIPVWQYRRPFSDFKAIEVWRATIDSESSIDRVSVGLLSCKDKYLEIRHYSVESGKPCCLAESKAQELSNSTGLPWRNFAPKISL
jgi:hypothetical protein